MHLSWVLAMVQSFLLFLAHGTIIWLRSCFREHSDAHSKLPPWLTRCSVGLRTSPEVGHLGMLGLLSKCVRIVWFLRSCLKFQTGWSARRFVCAPLMILFWKLLTYMLPIDNKAHVVAGAFVP